MTRDILLAISLLYILYSLKMQRDAINQLAGQTAAVPDLKSTYNA